MFRAETLHGQRWGPTGGREGGILWTGGRGLEGGVVGQGGAAAGASRGRWCSWSRARAGDLGAATQPGCGLESGGGAGRRGGWSSSALGHVHGPWVEPVIGVKRGRFARRRRVWFPALWGNRPSPCQMLPTSGHMGERTASLPGPWLLGGERSEWTSGQAALTGRVSDKRLHCTSLRAHLHGNRIALDRKGPEACYVPGAVRGRH